MKRKLLCIMMTGLFFASAISVKAAGYAPVKGTVTQFNQYLILDREARLPDVTFNYEIRAGSPQNYGEGKMAILAGISADKISVSDSVFSQTDAISTTPASGSDLTLTADQGYGVKPVNIDFSQVSFDEPGIYRYLLTMTSTGQQGIRYDVQAAAIGSKVRCLDVYVTDDNGTLQISGYVLHENVTEIAAGQQAGSAFGGADAERLSDKSDGFVNQLISADLKFGNEVEGNQGSKDKYFKFTLTLDNALKNTVYYLDISEAEASGTANSATIYDTLNNPTQIRTDENGKAVIDFYLKDGQYITVKGLTENTTYDLKETNEDYLRREGTDRVVRPASQDQPEKLHDDPVQGTIGNTDVYTGYTNTRNGVIPTGIIMSATPGIMMMTGAISSILLLVSRKRKESEE